MIGPPCAGLPNYDWANLRKKSRRFFAELAAPINWDLSSFLLDEPGAIFQNSTRFKRI
jgi:hypothetical protein